MTRQTPRRPARMLPIPLLALAMVLLLLGMWAGLLRLGWTMPLLGPTLPMAHGPLMIGGFLGTLIGLERAVALAESVRQRRRRLLYLGPLVTGLGATLWVAGIGNLGPILIALGSLGLLFMMALVYRLHPTWPSLVMGLGAAAWLAGNLLWLAGWPISQVMLWWLAFLILTIAGERLELSQMLSPPPAARLVFLAAIAAILAGALLPLLGGQFYAAGVRGAGLGMLVLGLWLLNYDIARRRLRAGGQARFIAIGLLCGYAWLVIGAALALRAGGMSAGPFYDAWLHALLLGFVFSMIFAHAPIVFPAVLGRPLAFHAAFYAHLILLQVSLALRITGDLALWTPLRQWGGLLNVLAILLFLANTVAALRRAARS